MDDLPFSLEDLPPEIRDKIDDIIEKNEDLDSQLDAIDELLFADRPLAKFDRGVKFDFGSESGIGSDSDSGHGVVQVTDLLNSSSTSSTLSRPADDEFVVNPQTLGSPHRAPVLREKNADDFISRLVVPSPPHSSDPATPKAKQFKPNEQRLTQPSPFVATRSPSNTKVREAAKDETLFPLPPPPKGFRKLPEIDASTEDLASGDLNAERVNVVRSGEKFLVTLDVSRGTPSAPISRPGKDLKCNVSRVLVREQERLPVNAVSVPVANATTQLPQCEATIEKSKSCTLTKTVLLPRSPSRTELYAWEKVPEVNSAGFVVPTSKANETHKNLAVSVPDVGNGKIPRPMELCLGSSEKMKLNSKKENVDTESVNTYISTPSRYSKFTTGSSVDLRKKKWRPISDFFSNSDGHRSEGASELASGDEVSDLDGTEEEAKFNSSDDHFSSLVEMRSKDIKPTQTIRVDPRTLKAHSLLTLYDLESDNKGRSQEKRSAGKKKHRASTSETNNRFSALFRRKAKFHKNAQEVKEKKSSERPESWNGIAPRESETGPHRSDYLYLAPLPVPTRCNSIPSPSLYSSVDSFSSRKTRSPPAPGDISDILRIDVRDLDIGDLQPQLNFSTFRGEIHAIKWSEEQTRFPVSNRWTLPESMVNNFKSNQLTCKSSLPTNVAQYDQDKSSLSHPNTMSTPPNDSQRKPGLSPASNNGSDSFHQNCKKNINAHPTKTQPLIRVTSPIVLNVTTYQTPAGKATASQSPRAINDFTSATPINASQMRVSLAQGDQIGSKNSLKRFNSATPGHVGHHHVPLQSSQSSRFETSGKEANDKSRILLMPNAISLQNNYASDQTNKTVPVTDHEEQKILQTKYDNKTDCDRAISDSRRMLSHLAADRDRLLSAAAAKIHNSSSNISLRTKRDILAMQSRQLVTDAKLMVSAATRSKQELISSLTAVIHTIARVFQSCRHVLDELPPGNKRMTLLDGFLEVGSVFVDTLTSANDAAGRRQNDPAMEKLMYHTTSLARALGKVINTIKCLDK